MSKKTLYIGSKNPGKLKEYRRLLDDIEWNFPEITSVEEPEEIGDSFEEIANLKARYYAKAMNALAVAEDAGLVVPSLGGSPGIYSARFADCKLHPETYKVLSYCSSGRAREEIDKANNERLLEIMHSFDDSKRSAYYLAQIAVSDKHENILYSKEFRFNGKIVQAPRGNKGFGYDVIFEPDATPGELASELDPEKKDSLSHRGKGILDLKKHLDNF